MTPAPLIVGEVRDLHIQAVAARLHTEPVVLDGEVLRTTPFLLDSSRLEVANMKASSVRGWLRRLSPPGWLEAADDPGIDGAIRSSFLAVLGAVLRTPLIEWLSTVDPIGAVENKAVQYRLVERAGCPVPTWLVTTDPRRAPIAGEWVAKPLGPGYFRADDGPRVVPVTRYDLRQHDDLTGAAFLLQRRVHAARHARVVTVRGRAFSAALCNDGLPLDWRQDARAHSSFVPYDDEPLGQMALAAADACGVRFSSQDWIQDSSGRWWFVDLNPGGQWLFLPEPVSNPVTDALARWLDGGH